VNSAGKRMKAALGIVLIIGIITGFAIGYGYFLIAQKQESWHQVTSFILATSNESMPEVFRTAYSYSKVYYSNAPDQPSFSIKGNFWRVKVETLSYYNYSSDSGSFIIYYSEAPMNIIRIWKDNAYHGNPYGSITMLNPDYDYNVTTFGYARVLDIDLYISWADKCTPVRAVHTFAGKGNYTISLEMTIGCFNFTVEEYR
jgi:hypothetical protein